MTPLDPAAARDAGARHGQLATPLQGGGLVLTGHKVVDHGWRAALLLAPGVFRCDVRPFDDTLQVMLRPLDLTVGWGAQNTHSSRWGRPAAEADVPWRGEWVCMLALEPRAIVARVELAVTRVAEREASHVLAHAVLREADPDVVRAAI
ncbi:MAG TPA: hypothetical protein VM266_11270 [Solirubrobacteraceae bacterium]|nr:hypothetical protein [Solirubrobacteraceae bacterium]